MTGYLTVRKQREKRLRDCLKLYGRLTGEFREGSGLSAPCGDKEASLRLFEVFCLTQYMAVRNLRIHGPRSGRSESLIRFLKKFEASLDPSVFEQGKRRLGLTTSPDYVRFGRGLHKEIRAAKMSGRIAIATGEA